MKRTKLGMLGALMVALTTVSAGPALALDAGSSDHSAEVARKGDKDDGDKKRDGDRKRDSDRRHDRDDDRDCIGLIVICLG